MASRRLTSILVAVFTASLLAHAACKRRSDPELTPEQLKQTSAGISAMPASIVAVIRVDVPVVAEAPVIKAMARAVLARNDNVAAAVARLGGKCGSSTSWLGELVIGIATRQDNGTYPTVIAIQSLLSADEFVGCMEVMVGAKSRQVALAAAYNGQEPVIHMGDGTASVWMAKTGVGTRGTQWLVANSEPIMLEALAAARGGANVLANTVLAPQLVSAGQGNLPLWAAGLVPSGFSSRMRVLSKERVSAGPSAFVLRVGLRDGLRVSLLAKLASISDANELKVLLNSEIGTLAMAAQFWGAGPYVSSIAVEAAGPMLILKAAYSAREIEQLLAAIDKAKANQQDAPPTLGVPLGIP